jgi:hypothetical protein
VLAEMCSDHDRVDVHPVIVRNGMILHAPGQLDLGRSTRLASPAQRRVVRWSNVVQATSNNATCCEQWRLAPSRSSRSEHDTSVSVVLEQDGLRALSG